MEWLDKVQEKLGFKAPRLPTRLSDEATRILQSSEVERFFLETEKECWNRWTGTDAEDVEGREKIYQFLRMSRKFRMFFENSIREGKIDAQKIMQQKR